MSGVKILLIDDEKNLLRVVSLNLANQGFLVDVALNAEDGLNLFLEKRHKIILCDLKLSGMSGIDLLAKIRDFDKQVIFIIITAFGDIKQAVNAMKIGADDFISKPVDIEGLSENLKIILSKKDRNNADSVLPKFNDSYNGKLCEKLLKVKENFIFKSRQMSEILNEISITAESTSNVLITGETGTGKELVARIIHDLSGRKGNFVPINCSAVPIDLLENEFFGHEKGSFTGAVSMQTGKFETADRGTLFLDEIGEMPLLMQAKLLRVLQDKEFSKIGSNDRIKINSRIICATNVELEKAVIEKKFREDLFYRINVLHFHIPPLRERKEDIMPLANFFLRKYSRLNKKNIKSVSEEAAKILMNWSFQGNIRELENIMERAVIVSHHNVLEPSSLPKTLVFSIPPRMLNEENTHGVFTALKHKNLGLHDLTESKNNLKLDQIEIEVIKKALESNGYNQTKSAAVLGISRKQLITKMKKYNLFK